MDEFIILFIVLILYVLTLFVVRAMGIGLKEECEICKNKERNQKIICVVAETKDLLALERAREYKGVYHVIGGLISPMDSIGPELLEIRSLVERVSKSEVDEIILAFCNPTTLF